MAEMSLAEAAAVLGVTVEELRRRIGVGDLSARTTLDGRYLVRVDEAAIRSPLQESILSMRPQTELGADLRAERDRLQLEAAHAQELLAEVRRQRDDLATHLALQRDQLQVIVNLQQQDSADRAELRQLREAARRQQTERLLDSVEQAAREAGIKRKRRTALLKLVRGQIANS